MRIASDPCEGLPRLERIHAGQLCTLLLNYLLLLQDEFEQLEKLLCDCGLGIPDTISLVKCSMA